MKVKKVVEKGLKGLRIALSGIALFQFSLGGPVANAQRSSETATPIKHVIVIIGENRSFDHVFATYVPRPGQQVQNLLSKGIIQLDSNKNAIPGPNFYKAQQFSASDLGTQDTFLLSPPKQEFPSNQLPAPEAGGPSGTYGYFTPSSSKYTTIACGTTTVNGKTTTNYLTPAACAMITENGLPNASDANGLTYYQSLASGGTGQYSYTPDLRIVNFWSLPAGPFQRPMAPIRPPLATALPTRTTAPVPCTASTRCGSS
jgi:phospholipase C